MCSLSGFGEAATQRDTRVCSDVIEGLVVGAECQRPKPFPDPYLIAMQRLSAAPSECVVFEDSSSGGKQRVLWRTMYCKQHPKAAFVQIPARIILYYSSSWSLWITVKAAVAAGVTAIVGIRSTLNDCDLCASGARLTVHDWREVNPSLINPLLD